MTRVLFVDDEPKILRGLERMLHGLDCGWETAFATSGREALALMDQQPFDVVVSDMRMPEMDGAALLREVMERHPQAVRIALSGHSEHDLVLRSIGVTHQYLGKPCDAAQLQGVITRAIALRQFLAEPALRSLVSQLWRIPSMPEAYRELMAQMQRPSTSLRDLGHIVTRDVGMTAKILQIVNSSFFGLPRHVADPAQAVCLLGLNALRALVMTIHIFTELRPDRVHDVALDNLWTHCTETGAIAKMIAAEQGCERGTCDHALVAGLLHDAGKLVLAANLGEQYRAAMHRAAEEGIPRAEAERQVFGATHAEVGAYLLGLWGLPDPVVEAVAFHHHPADCSANTFTALTAVHVGHALQYVSKGAGEEELSQKLDMQHLQQLGLAERWPAWRDLCMSRAEA
ncbi:MAG: response regulator [Phycisphaerae bacterium]|jgi:putative nucleotidyltransferase with HDIG domain